MSHSVTITRTTTSTTNTSYIVLNTGYLKSFSGLLKLAQLIIGAVCVGIFSYYVDNRSVFTDSQDLFCFLMATTFMIATFCLLLSCLTSLSTGGIISKTIYELIYHSIAGILLLISSAMLLIELNKNSRYKGYKQYDAYLAASIMGLVNCVLYFISAFLAHKSYRGI